MTNNAEDLTRTTPEERVYQRSVSTITWQMMAVCALLFVIGGAVILAFVFWQSNPAELAKPRQDNEIEVRIDPGEFAFALLLLIAGAAICSGITARLIAKRAVRPIDEAFRLQRRFVADVSHELRTPLAVLGARTQQLELLTVKDDPRYEIVQALRADTRIMSEVVTSMLEAAARGEHSEGSAKLESTIASVVADMVAIAKTQGVIIESDAAPAFVALPEAQLRRALIALLDNAIQHSPVGSTVRVTGERMREHAVVTVADQGGGIQGIDHRAVFTRFAYGNDTPGAARRKSNNLGIGLALVQELCLSHGGDVRVATSGPQGTVFEMTLPLAGTTKAER
ncbi:HAMP domain-containing sensor histidine kinase [Leucobacter sp. UT-8R-CII-1-4]|uniref:sensor histidine kinase n=1 Tax=Leucobacter sp. UT-8R-CII-1-4 TaxID=3040075 RepID=UPI0024A9DF6A|nr:HAMP domain-containing sensor histidine kinase [Leucobacter sp. UT-8R-CII-1-4]MDI6024249.1 HAMP domain-containing sensor histidine kinase [Leucobacter sp. UT-8R-CII-1-4]